MNIELLQKIKEQIVSHPEDFRMEKWFCGTAACIGGWAYRLSGHEDQCGNIDTMASALLNVSYPQASRLFYTDLWPKQFREPFMYSLCQQGKANIAAARIDYFIETGL